MGLTNRYAVLYWHRSLMPSAAQVEDARKYGPHVMFRNANFHRDGDACEPCTAVAGEVPKDYLRMYPEAVTYNEWVDGKLPVKETAPPPQPGALALGVNSGDFASRVLDPDAPRPTRAERRAAAEAVDGNAPLDGMTGQDSADRLPPPPPSAAGRSLTGDVFLPPPPPPE